MSYNKVGMWAKGYLEALMAGDEISKSQLEVLIDRVREMIDDEEANQDNEFPTSSNYAAPADSTDDLPF